MDAASRRCRSTTSGATIGAADVSTPSYGRGGADRLVALLAAPLPQRVVDRRRGRPLVRGDEQLDGVHARTRGSRPPRASRARAAPSRLDPLDQLRRRTRARRRAAARGGRGCRRTASARRGRRAGARPCRCEVGRGDLRPLEERHLAAVVGRHVLPGRRAREPLGERARRSPRRCAPARGTRRRERRRRARRARAAPARTAPSARARGPGPTTRRPPRRSRAPASSSARPRPAPRSPASTVRKPAARAACAASGTSRSRS